jgi:hypothetical protein
LGNLQPQGAQFTVAEDEGVLQSAQSLRTSRWASMARTAEAMRKGFTPMSLRRATALGASFVCRVEKTK